MQKTFRCLKYDIKLMRKRCIERQNIDDSTKKIHFPLCTIKCAQGKKTLKALGGASYLKKIICDEPGCKKPARKKGKCAACYQKQYWEKRKMEKTPEKIRPDTLEPLLSALEEEINQDEMVSTSNCSEALHGKCRPEFINVNISFKNYPELGKEIQALAKVKFRTFEMQILYILNNLYLKNRIPQKKS